MSLVNNDIGSKTMSVFSFRGAVIAAATRATAVTVTAVTDVDR